MKSLINGAVSKVEPREVITGSTILSVELSNVVFSLVEEEVYPAGSDVMIEERLAIRKKNWNGETYYLTMAKFFSIDDRNAAINDFLIMTSEALRSEVLSKLS